MTTPASYTYLPWLRRGLAVHLRKPDPLDASVAAAAELGVTLTVALDGSTELTDEVPVTLRGPADVVALDPRQVLHTYPAPGDRNVEPNYFAHVDLARPDLPWMFSPVSATGKGRLRPWLVLAVIEAREGVSFQPGAAGLPERLHIDDGAADELPPLDESWAWAHVQVAGQLANAKALETVLRDTPHRVRCRLVCPRYLRPDARWHACLLPAFAVGRRQGLGERPTPAELAELSPAWASDAKGLTLPVYHRWSFSTGAAGDFESLARGLQPFPMPDTVGSRALHVGQAGAGLPEGGEEATTRFRGALVSPASPSESWDRSHSLPFRQGLRKLVNDAARPQPDGVDDPVIGPPLYGRWHAAVDRLTRRASSPEWVRELNLDPALRAVAAVAGDVVREHQDELMHSAWEQVGDVLEANAALRRAQLAREANRSLQRRHFDTLPNDDARVQLAGPTLARVSSGGATVRGHLRDSALPEGAAGGALRRVARPRGPAARTTGAQGTSWASRALGGLGRGSLAVGDDLPQPAGVATTGAVASVEPLPGSTKPDLDALDDYLTGFADFTQTYARTPAAPPDLDDAGLEVRAALNPDLAVLQHATHRLALPQEYWSRTDPLDPVLAAPSFPQPMAARLPDEWLVPGLEVMPDEAVGVLVTHPHFVEAFMVGLNHEMARELLWREYPTDQRGTCFRQFWDVRGQVPPPSTEGEVEAARDIPPLHQWSGNLGAHLTGAGADPDGLMVVVVRGALLRRYPNAVVYLARATWEGQRRAPLRDQNDVETHEYPLFTGTIGADVHYLGFGISAATAAGEGLPTDDVPTPDAGWFVVFQEQPTEPRFGLDEGGPTSFGALTRWPDVGWDTVGASPGDHLVLAGNSGTIDGVTWRRNAAHMAHITLQTPARVLFHADALLPGDPDA